MTETLFTGTLSNKPNLTKTHGYNLAIYILEISLRYLARDILKKLDLPFLCIFDPGLLFKIFSTLVPF